MKKLLLAAAAGAAFLLQSADAEAHAFLDHALPAVGSTIHQPPTEIRIWFTEAIEPFFSTIKISDIKGPSVATGPAQADPKDKTILVLKLPPLQPGTYRVEWRALSVDTHTTQGSFHFEIAP